MGEMSVSELKMWNALRAAGDTVAANRLMANATGRGLSASQRRERLGRIATRRRRDRLTQASELRPVNYRANPWALRGGLGDPIGAGDLGYFAAMPSWDRR